MSNSAIISKTKLEGLMGMGVVDAEMLELMNLNYFMSTKSEVPEIMVAISPKMDVTLEARESDKETITAESLASMVSFGLIKDDRINSGELTISQFNSTYGNKGKLVTIGKRVESSLTDILAGINAPETDISEDGVVDAYADVEADAAF